MYEGLQVDSILTSENGILIRWTSPLLGSGEYFVSTKNGLLTADSDRMDRNDSKVFLRMLFGLVVDKVQVMG